MISTWLFFSLGGLLFAWSGWIACRVYLHFSGRYDYGAHVERTERRR